jgi:hypothetical protein
MDKILKGEALICIDDETDALFFAAYCKEKLGLDLVDTKLNGLYGIENNKLVVPKVSGINFNEGDKLVIPAKYTDIYGRYKEHSEKYK